MKNYIQSIEEKGNQLLVAHQAKEVDSIGLLLNDLVEERNHLRVDINSVTHLINLVEKHQIEIEKQTLEVANHKELSKWMVSLKHIFEGIYTSKKESLNKEEIEFIQLELPKLLANKDNLVKQLMYLDSIIVKTVNMIQNLRNGICIQITKGKDIKNITKDLKDTLGNSIEGNYYTSTQLIISFLENKYELNKIESKELFDVLEKNKEIEYRIDVSEDNLVYNYKKIGLSDKNIPLNGAWYLK